MILFSRIHALSRTEAGTPHERDLGECTLLASVEGASLLARASELLRDPDALVLLAGSAPSAAREAALRAIPTPFGARLGFLTSGSTGEPKAVWKSGRCLEAEASALAEILGPGERGCHAAPADACVVALVPPCHLYGFLFAALLPELLGRDVCFVEPGTPPAVVPPAALLVAVPSLFAYCAELAAAGRVAGRVVFSGAPLGAEKRARAEEAFPLGAVEIIGSTETGGMGISRASRGEACYVPLPGVALEPVEAHDAEGLVRLRSPYLFPEGRLPELDDRVVVRPDGTFTHHGRRDRVFKYAGRRHALGEIEDALRALCDGAPARCFFVEDPGHPKGGRLLAFVAREEGGGLRALRDAWLSRFPLPFPHEVRFLAQFPRDAMGKVTLESLLKA